MTCRRCHGFMVAERFDNPVPASGDYEFGGWRCVNCGAIVDPLLTGHQRAARGTSGTRSSPPQRRTRLVAG